MTPMISDSASTYQPHVPLKRSEDRHRAGARTIRASAPHLITLLALAVAAATAQAQEHAPGGVDCGYQSPEQALAAIRASVAAGEISDPALRVLPEVRPRFPGIGRGRGIPVVPTVIDDDIFPFEDTAGLLLTNFSDGALFGLMAEATNALLVSEGDLFDFVAFFINFTPNHTIGAAFYMGLENDVDGIGRTPFNIRAGMGVTGVNVEGWVMMWNQSSWSPGASNFTALVLGQEFEHRFAMFLSPFVDGRQLQGTAGCGRGSHWNFRVDAQGSGMEVAEWTGSSPATRQGTLIVNTDIGGVFSYPDLYLMGYVSGAEMDSGASELRYMNDSCGSPYAGPISAWTSADIVAANGARIPDSTTAQKDFRTGWIMLHQPGAPPSQPQLDNVVAILNSWNDVWINSTLGRGTMNNTLFKDCNSNGIDDREEIAAGTATDCNNNTLPDDCESPTDCNANGAQDICDLALGTSLDCNGNFAPDECDISGGSSSDDDSNGVPDECEAEVLFVDVNVVGSRAGTTWANAFTDLQAALAIASTPGSAATQIWVAAGTYQPDDGSADRSATFELLNGVGVYGGFSGGETSLTQRDPATNVCILSGDIGTPADASDNSYHVVSATMVDATAVLDGLTITDGNASGVNPDDRGAGMLIQNADPTIRNCRIIGNSAVGSGGGVFNLGGAGLLMSNCLFMGNSAGTLGGGLFTNASAPAIVNCRFLNNSASNRGGGLGNGKTGNTTVVNCSFSGNSANFGGGLGSNGKPILANCSFTLNSATSSGGGIYNLANSSILTLTNSVLWNNSDSGGTDESAQIDFLAGSKVINYSCLQGLTGALGGVGNIGADPLFADADGGDNVPGTEDDDLALLATSPCIDAGNNAAVPSDATDLDDDGDAAEPTPLDGVGRSRFTDDFDTADTGLGTAPVVDMGSLEFSVTCPNPCGDISGDGAVNLQDFATFALCFNRPPTVSQSCLCSDLNTDNAINLADFATFALIFNQTPSNFPPNCSPSP